MKEHLKQYKVELEKQIGKYMEIPTSIRSVEIVDGMTRCWMHLDEAEKMLDKCYSKNEMLTYDEATKWVDGMQNDDGTTGGHWTKDQTTQVAKSIGIEFEHISEECFYVAMNMMYSDYYKVANTYGVGTPEFYAQLAKAFLFDKDAKSPKQKISAYYHGIVAM